MPLVQILGFCGNMTTVAKGVRCLVSGIRKGWPTYAAEY